MANEGGKNASIEIGTVEEGKFVVNRYTTKDGEVIEEEVDAGLSEDDMAAIEDEIGSALDETLEQFDREEQTASQGQSQTQSPSEMESQTGVSAEAAQQATESAPDDGGSEEPPAPADLRAAALEVVEERDVTKNDWPAFSAGMRERGFEDSDDQSDIWNDLRDEGIINGPDDGGGTDSSGSDTQESDGEATEETTETTDDGGDGDAEVMDEVPPALQAIVDQTTIPEDVGIVEAILAATPGDDASDAAVEQFDSLIRDGSLRSVSPDRDPEVREAMEAAGVEEPPALLFRTTEGLFAVAMGGDDSTGADSGGTDMDGDGETGGGVQGTDFEEGDDIVLLESGTDAGEKIIDALLDAIAADEVVTLPLESDETETVIEPLGDDEVEVPMHIVAEDGTFKAGDLEALLQEWA